MDFCGGVLMAMVGWVGSETWSKSKKDPPRANV